MRVLFKKHKNILMFVLLTLGVDAHAVDLSKGQTFQIIEPDILVEIKAKANTVDWKSLSKNMKLVRSQVQLPTAKEDRAYYFKPITKLPFEVKDKNGKILYEKGFEFNPLLYVSLPNQLIVLGSPSHLDYLTSISFLTNPGDILLIANIDTPSFIDKTKRRAFVLTQSAADRLGITHVPSVIKQVGDQFFIQEFAPKEVAR